MRDYKMNFTTGTLTISKDFEERAMILNSKEFKILKEFKNMNPDLTIERYRRKSSSTPNRARGLTYKKMENYIKLFENSAELLQMFETVKAVSRIQPYPYNYVFAWFEKQFPKYKELPEFKDGKLYAQIIPFPQCQNSNKSVS